jgi:hypothetical protein
MTVGSKRRKWLAFMSVSASGPEYSPLPEERGYFVRPRVAADLKCTTADVDYLESHFKEPNYDSGDEEAHLRLRNPTRERFFESLNGVIPWLGSFGDGPNWDGGGFMLCFAGHGREGDGALVLEDGVLTPEALTDALAGIASHVSSPRRMRVSIVLDSCHSGAFATKILDSCFREQHELLVPWMVYASCMEDELAWEESSLGHGLFTYCFSVREHTPESYGATAVQPNNTVGPSLAIAAGEIGCSLLSVGRQNPVVYFNGTGHLEVCGRHFDMFEGDEYMGLNAVRARLRRERDEVVEIPRPMRLNHFVRDYSNDEEVRADLRELIQLSSQAPQLTERKTRRHTDP